MDSKIEIEGLEGLRQAIRETPRFSLPILDKAIKKSILDIQRVAVPLTPIDTGRLRGSYRTEFRPFEGKLYPIAEYAYTVHESYARHRVGQRKYLETAANRSQAQIKKNMKDALDKIFGKLSSMASLRKYLK